MFPAAVISYCRETADFAFLDEVTDYAEVDEGQPGGFVPPERNPADTKSAGQVGLRGTILEHCQRAVERVWADRSPRACRT